MTLTITLGHLIEILVLLTAAVTFIVRTGSTVKAVKVHADGIKEDLEALKEDNRNEHRAIVGVIQKACNGDRVIVPPELG